jgi:hypothetical protein
MTARCAIFWRGASDRVRRALLRMLGNALVSGSGPQPKPGGAIAGCALLARLRPCPASTGLPVAAEPALITAAGAGGRGVCYGPIPDYRTAQIKGVRLSNEPPSARRSRIEIVRLSGLLE